jgi:hypothetical protein
MLKPISGWRDRIIRPGGVYYWVGHRFHSWGAGRVGVFPQNLTSVNEEEAEKAVTVGYLPGTLTLLSC